MDDIHANNPWVNKSGILRPDGVQTSNFLPAQINRRNHEFERLSRQRSDDGQLHKPPLSGHDKLKERFGAPARMPIDDVPDAAPERRTAETLRTDAGSSDLLTSAGQGWRLIEARRFRQSAATVELPACDAEIVAVLYKGSPYIESWIDGCRFDGMAQPRHLCFLPAHTEARVQFHSECEILHIYLNSDVMALAARDAGVAGVRLLPRFLFRDPIIGHTADRLTGEMRLPGLATQLFAECVARKLALQILRSHPGLPTAQPVGATGLAPWKLRRVQDYIGGHLDRDMTLYDLATIARMSIFHFVRCFKQSTGFTPRQYVIRRRIEMAKGLLQDSDLDVGRIALAVGLRSQSHFADIFQRCTGMTPTRFRRLVKT